MTLTKTISHDGNMIDFGSNARIERRMRPERVPVIGQDGKPALDTNRQPVTVVKADKEGNPVYIWVAYEKIPVGEDRKHPVHGQPTGLAEVWVVRGEGTMEEAREIALKYAKA